MIAINIMRASNVIVIVDSDLFFTFDFLPFFALFKAAFMGLWDHTWLRDGPRGFDVYEHLLHSVTILFFEGHNDFNNLCLSNAWLLYKYLNVIHPKYDDEPEKIVKPYDPEDVNSKSNSPLRGSPDSARAFAISGFEDMLVILYVRGISRFL